MKDDPDFNTHFVAIVRKHSCLYDSTCIDYSNRYVQDRAWDSIANEIQETVPDCKERWRNLRGCYTRHLKSTVTPTFKRRQPYYLAECMSFLTPFTKARRSKNSRPSSLASKVYCEISEVRNKHEAEHETLSEAAYSDHSFGESNPSRNVDGNILHPASVEYVSESQYEYPQPKTQCVEIEADDPDYCFLKCILPDMKEMDSFQKRQFKIGILNLAQEILSEQKVFPTPSTHT